MLVLNAAVAVVGGMGIVMGAAALTREWVLPWMRGQVCRPRLWGLGGALLGCNALLQALWPYPGMPSVTIRLLMLGVGLVLVTIGSRSRLRRGGRARGGEPEAMDDAQC